jgi:hypothetical protein
MYTGVVCRGKEGDLMFVTGVPVVWQALRRVACPR